MGCQWFVLLVIEGEIFFGYFYQVVGVGQYGGDVGVGMWQDVLEVEVCGLQFGFVEGFFVGVGGQFFGGQVCYVGLEVGQVGVVGVYQVVY